MIGPTPAIEIRSHGLHPASDRPRQVSTPPEPVQVLLQREHVMPAAQDVLRRLQAGAFADPGSYTRVPLPLHRVPELLAADARGMEIVGAVDPAQTREVVTEDLGTAPTPSSRRVAQPRRNARGTQDVPQRQQVARHRRRLNLAGQSHQRPPPDAPQPLQISRHDVDDLTGPPVIRGFGAQGLEGHVAFTHTPQPARQVAQAARGPSHAAGVIDHPEDADGLAQPPRRHPGLVHSARVGPEGVVQRAAQLRHLARNGGGKGSATHRVSIGPGRNTI